MDRLLQLTREAENRHFWFHGLRRFVEPHVAAAAAPHRGPRLLDCGCGTGANLDLVLSRYGTAFGLDRSAFGVGAARHRGQPRTLLADVGRVPFPDNAFDVCTSFDVLYGLDDRTEHRAVDEMYRVLRPGGVAIVHVAALPLLRGNHSVLSQEVRRYTRGSLRTLLEGAGFRVTRLTYTQAAIFPLLLVVRLGQRWMGLRPPETADREIRVPPGPVNRLLSAGVTLEALALRHVDMPIGGSLLCVAKKPEAGAVDGGGVTRGADRGAR